LFDEFLGIGDGPITHILKWFSGTHWSERRDVLLERGRDGWVMGVVVGVAEGGSAERGHGDEGEGF
jgi:hypothetical protein